jgi:transposase-like protein
MQVMKNCPRCDSERIFKYGIIRNKQRYKCKDCNFNFTTAEKRGKPNELKIKALHMYLEGIGLRKIGRLLGVSQVSVLNWIKKFAANMPTAPQPDKVEVMELDEMWHYVGKKNKKGGYGSLFVALPSKSLDLQWVVVERQQEESCGKK